jgi:hypothetical protein
MPPLPKLDAMFFSQTNKHASSGEESRTTKDLRLVMEVRGIVGLSCDGQEGKLADVLGQLVAEKHGKGASLLAGLREAGFSNEASNFVVECEG